MSGKFVIRKVGSEWVLLTPFGARYVCNKFEVCISQMNIDIKYPMLRYPW